MNIRTKRVALMVNSLQFGGIERVISNLSKYLEESGYEIHLLLMDDSDIAYPYGGKVHRISFYYKKNAPVMSLLTWQHWILTYYFKIKLKIDVTISAFEFLNVLNLLAPHGVMIPTLHNYRLQCDVSPIVKDRIIEWIFSKIVKKANSLVVVSEGIKQKIKSLYHFPPQKITCIYNMFDDDTIRQSAAKQIDSEIERFITDQTFVTMARMVDQKSIHKLIIALSCLTDKYPEARLIIVGDGPMREKLSQLVISLNLQEKVYMTKFLQNPFGIVSRSGKFVLSSYYEGFGNVIVEAMCCSACVIATDCKSGPREIIAPDTNNIANGIELCEYGILTTPHDGKWTIEVDKSVTHLAQAMEMIITDEALYRHYREQSAKRALDFTVSVIGKKWIDCIERTES